MSLSDERIAEIRARVAAAEPGPWRWGGNLDSGHPRLFGRREVLGLLRVERTADDPGAKAFRTYLSEQSVEDGEGGWRSYTDDQIEEIIRDDYLTDPWGEPMYDNRLAFVGPEGLYKTDREIPVYAVCPDATSRHDPRVYRADITGFRNPNAEFIANSRQDVDDLLAALEERDEQLATATHLLEYALHLRMYGERAPGGNENWPTFERDCEQWLRRDHPGGGS